MNSIVFARATVAAVGAICLAGCVQIPQRDGIAAADINAVVKRIKCDLSKIVLDKAYKTYLNERLPERRQPFLFLRSWAAKVRLTVAVDDNVQFNPGATFNSPLHTVNNISQTFTLGVGAGLTTQAIRQEDVEFLISFKDLDADYYNGKFDSPLYDFCRQEPGLLLESDLGLDRLIDAALKPVETGVLKPGNNIGPGTSPPPAIPKLDLPRIAVEVRKVDPALTINDLAGGSTKIRQYSDKMILKFNIPNDLIDKSTKQLIETQSIKNENAELIKTLLSNSAEATAIEVKTQAIINNVVKPRYELAQGALDNSCIKSVSEANFEAIAQAANVSAFVINIDKSAELASERPQDKPPSDAAASSALKAAADSSTSAFQKLIAARDGVIAATNTMRLAMQDCALKSRKIRDDKKKEGPAVFDPISSISETVNFYITATGSVAPSWKLVRVTAPTSANFLYGSRKDTNTLILSMGRPSPGSNGGPPNTSGIDQQILYSILGQALPNARP